MVPNTDIVALREDFQSELTNILEYWLAYTVDINDGGFYGSLTNDNKIVPDATKGAVLNARILWSFSAGYNSTGRSEYLDVAKRSFEYILNHFVDKEYGGVYWSVTAKGEPLDTKKQIYALAFTIYGLSEYYLASGERDALELAKKLFYDIEQHSHDSKQKGYIEALTRDWQLIDDLRLSDKDLNEKKTMNSHLHILEAYTALYRIWPNRHLDFRLRELLKIFTDHIVDRNTYHLGLFFDEQWERRSQTISYGHDIEASWLLCEAADVLGDKRVIHSIQKLAVKIANAAAEGLTQEGSMYYEFEPESNHVTKEKHWWVQAEAMVGFLNAWKITGNEYFFQRFSKVWEFIKNHILNSSGEWVWGVNEDNSIMDGYDKAGFWKCPYHNSRSCLEVHRLLGSHLKQSAK